MISILLLSGSALILLIGFFACIYGIKKQNLKGIIIFDECCGVSGLILVGLFYCEHTISHLVIGIILIGWAFYDFAIREKLKKKSKRGAKRKEW